MAILSLKLYSLFIVVARGVLGRKDLEKIHRRACERMRGLRSRSTKFQPATPVKTKGRRWREQKLKLCLWLGSCIIALWFRDGIYKVCSTWPELSSHERLGRRCCKARHYRRDIYTGCAFNASRTSLLKNIAFVPHWIGSTCPPSFSLSFPLTFAFYLWVTRHATYFLPKFANFYQTVVPRKSITANYPLPRCKLHHSAWLMLPIVDKLFIRLARCVCILKPLDRILSRWKNRTNNPATNIL